MIASVPLGIARHALEAFKDLAGVKKPTRSQDLLRARAVAQSQLGEAEGLLRAGRAFLLEALDEAWEVARRDRLPGRGCQLGVRVDHGRERRQSR